jgi:hypothetical protein
MSTPCTLMTAAVPPELVPDILQSTEQAIDLIDPGYKRERYLLGGSEGGWLLGAVNRLSDAFSIEGLEFFRYETASIRDGDCRAFLFKSLEIERTCAAVGTMLACAASQPEVAGRVIDSYDAADVLDALRRAEPSVHPKARDGGYGVDYLFAYLRSFEHLCRAALADGWSLVHVQWN